MLLADMGAEVIKIEDTRAGDYIRWWEPMLGKNSGMHVVLNRNKKSMKLNLKTEAGKGIFLKLVEQCDVLIEGFRPGVMDKLGVGYKVLSEINAGLIYCAISGYGSTGPLSQKAGHDVNYLALNGVLSYCGQNGTPIMPGVQIADIGGGALLAAFAILCAIVARQKKGKGQFIDIGMADGAMLWNCLRFGNWIADGNIPTPGDSMLNHGFACYNIYETKDGRFMSLGALEPQFWKVFCEAVGRPDLDTPEYFKAGKHQEKLKESVAAIFKARTQSEWVDFLKDADCCCEPVLNLEEMSNHPQFLAREMVVKMNHPEWGNYLQLGMPARFSGAPGELKTHAPEYGEHTQEILSGLGLSDDKIARLKKDGVI